MPHNYYRGYFKLGNMIETDNKPNLLNDTPHVARYE